MVYIKTEASFLRKKLASIFWMIVIDQTWLNRPFMQRTSNWWLIWGIVATNIRPRCGRFNFRSASIITINKQDHKSLRSVVEPPAARSNICNLKGPPNNLSIIQLPVHLYQSSSYQTTYINHRATRPPHQLSKPSRRSEVKPTAARSNICNTPRLTQ